MVSKRGEKVLVCIIFSPFILASMLYIYVSAFMLYYNTITASGPAPKFIGYESLPMRIDQVNLTEVISKGNTPTITIREEWEVYPEEGVHWRFYLGKRDAAIHYTRGYKENYSLYKYWFVDVDGKNNTLPIFWTKLQMYFNLTEEELQHEMEDIDKESARGKFVGKRPDWSLILEDLGEPVSVYTSQVGYERAYYGNWTSANYNTYCVVVEKETEDPSVLTQLFIDGDTDIQLKILCYNKLDDPKALFVELFEHVGLSTSLLDSIELKENFLYPV